MGGAVCKCHTHKALDLPTFRFGTSRSMVRFGFTHGPQDPQKPPAAMPHSNGQPRSNGSGNAGVRSQIYRP